MTYTLFYDIAVLCVQQHFIFYGGYISYALYFFNDTLCSLVKSFFTENLTCVSSILHFSPCELYIFLRVCSYILSILSSLCELHTVCIIYPCELYNIFSPCVLTFSRMSSIYYLPCVSSILSVFLLVNYMSILNNFSLCAYILSYA